MLDCISKFPYTQYMFTLTKASKETKIILKLAAVITVVFIILFILFKFFSFVINIFFPSPPPKPTLYFGKLSYPAFPQSVSGKTFTYSVNTISGQLPMLKTVVKINRIEVPKPDLLSLRKISEKVSRAGFNNDPAKISNTVYDWNDTSDVLKKRIRVNILNYNFNLTADPYSDPDVVTGKNVPKKEEAISMAENFLKETDYLAEDLDLSKTQIKIYSLKNNGFTEASSISNAQVLQVIFFQKDIDSIPIVYKTPGQSNIDVLVVGGNFQPQILGANYIHHTISDVSSTYPIKSTQQAFDDLKEGKAYIASYHGTESNIAISKVYLSFYFSDQDHEYTMPVIVFEGNDNFVAYVSAVTDEWINK